MTTAAAKIIWTVTSEHPGFPIDGIQATTELTTAGALIPRVDEQFWIASPYDLSEAQRSTLVAKYGSWQFDDLQANVEFVRYQHDFKAGRLVAVEIEAKIESEEIRTVDSFLSGAYLLGWKKHPGPKGPHPSWLEGED